MNFVYLDFKEDLSETVASRHCDGNYLFICSHYRCLTTLKIAFQKYSQLKPAIFLTMDEFKFRMLPAKLPLIKEDKRTLAFYQCLLELNLQEVFHVYDYFSSLPLARNFFDLFEELAEEYLDQQQVIKVLTARESQNQWQLHHFQHLIKLKDHYHKFLSEKGYSDVIFLKENRDIATDYLCDFDKIIILNKLHFTQMEKSLLPSEKTLMYLQLPPELYDESHLCCREELSASYLTNSITQSVNCHIFSDLFSQKYFLFSQKFTNSDTIIDTGNLCEHLKSYNIPVCYPFKVDFSRSSLHRFISALHLLTRQIIIREDILLLPINALISTASDQSFINYFATKAKLPKQEFEIVWENLQEWLDDLIDESYKYLDFKLRLLRKNPPTHVKEIMIELFNFLSLFKNTDSFQEFRNLLESEQINYFWHVISDKELKFSNLPEIYSGLLTDFWTLADSNLISDWHTFAPNDPTGFALAGVLLKLLADFAKAKQFVWNYQDFNSALPDITTLPNTRNLSFERVYIVDAIEGNLPSAKKPPFLLTENQRKQLNLYTHQDLILQEKYNFLRLVAQSKIVHILTRQQESDSTEISSFVEDIKLHQPQIFNQNRYPLSYEHKGHFQFWLPANDLSQKPPCLPADFFSLEFEPDKDLKDHTLILSPSSVQSLIDQPFTFYFDRVLKLKENKIQIEMDFSPLQQGIIIHAAFSRLWIRLLNVFNHQSIVYNFAYNQDNYAQRALDSYFTETPEFLLQRPHNHSDLFFRKIVKQFYIDSIKSLLQEFEKNFSNIPLTIIPEIENGKNQNKRCCIGQFNDFSAILQGRADLRIEPAGMQKRIIDYKTGSHSKSLDSAHITQLNLYHLLYYPQESIKKAIYFVSDQFLKSYDSNSPDLPKLPDDLINTLSNLADTGYLLRPKKIDHTREALTRSDLFMLRSTDNES